MKNISRIVNAVLLCISVSTMGADITTPYTITIQNITDCNTLSVTLELKNPSESAATVKTYTVDNNKDIRLSFTQDLQSIKFSGWTASSNAAIVSSIYIGNSATGTQLFPRGAQISVGGANATRKVDVTYTNTAKASVTTSYTKAIN